MHIGSKPKLSRVAVGMLALLVAVQVLPPLLGFDSPFGWATGIQAQNNPTACDAVGSNWTNCQDAFSSNNLYAYANDSAGGGGGPDSAFKDGVSVAVPTVKAAIDSIATTLPDAPNLVIAVVQFDNTAAAVRNILATNLDLRRGATVIATYSASADNIAVRLAGTGAPFSEEYVVLLGRDATPGANPTYEVQAAANATGVNAEVKFLVMNGLVHSAGVQGTGVATNSTEQTLATLTTSFPAATATQPHILIAAIHTDSDDDPIDVAIGNIKIKRGATVIASNEFRWGAHPRSNVAGVGQHALLVAEDPNGLASETYTVTILDDVGGGGHADAALIGIAGHDADAVDSGSVAVGTTRTVIGSIATSFAVGDDMLITAFQSDSLSGADATYAAASLDTRLSGDATTDAENEFAHELEENAPASGYEFVFLGDVVNKITTTAANPTYEAGALAPATSTFNAEAKMVAIHINGGGGPGGPGKNDTAWKDFGFAIDPSATINTVEVGVEWFRTSSEPVLNVTISWDGGLTWATNQTATNKSADDDTVEFLDFTSATAWTAAKLNDTNLRVRVGTNASDARLDYVTVRVDSNTPPVISNFRIEEAGVPRAGTQLDVNTSFDYLFNVTDADGWSDIASDGNVSLRLWYDGNGTPTIDQRDPTACAAIGNDWTNCQDAFSSNNIYSYANGTGSGGGAITFQRAGGSGQSNTHAIDIGTAGNDRLVVVYGSIETTFQGQLSDVTVDGKSANFIALAQNNAGAGSHTQMWAIDEAALGSSSGVVTCVLVGATGSWGIHVQVFYGVDSSTAFDSAIDNTSVDPDNEVKPAVVDIPANGLLVFLASHGSTGTWNDADWDTSPTEATDDGLSPEIEMTEVTDGIGPGSPGGPFSAVMGTAYWISTESQQNNRQLRAQASANPFIRASGVIASFSAASGGGGPGNNDTAWRNFGFALSGSITQVEVGVEWFRNNTAPILNVSISWDGGASWATNQTATNKSADDNIVEFLDFTSATAWTPAKLNDANLRVRVGTNASGARLDYVTVRVTSSTGELTFSQQTTGANYRIVLTYLDTADPTTASLSEWSVTEGRATYNASASGLTAILSGPTIIGYEFRLALKFGFQVKHAVAPTNSTVGAYNDLDSWNGEVVATDGPHTITLQKASTGEHMEFGVFMYTFVNISADWTVTVGVGQTANTNTVTVFRRSNDDFTLRIWFVTDLIKGGDTIPITNVQILAAGDLTDDITADTAFAGLGEGNATYILGSATLWFSHSTGTDEDTTTVQFSVTVAFGTPLGLYTAQLTIRIQQQP